MYEYRARDQTGRPIQGTMEAESERVVITQLRERGYMPTVLHQQVVARSIGQQVREMSPVPRQDLVIFTRQLATMVSAGLPLVSALETTARQTESRRLREVLEKVRGGIEAGGNLAGEMAKHPAVFSDLYVSTLQAGEVSGALDRVLNYLADYLERELDLVQRIKTTAMYPAIVFVAAVLVGVVAVFVVLPQLVGLFSGLKVALPWPTRVLIAVTNGARRYWYLLLAMPFSVGTTIIVLRRSKAGRRFLDHILIRVPVVGRLILKVSLARFARMLAMIARSGVPLVQGMEIVAHAAGNASVADAVEGAAHAVQEGQPLAASLGLSPLIPLMFSRMVAVGEQTGALETILDKIADFYDREVDNTVRRFAALIEPVMIIGVGAVVAFVAVAILLPLWRLIGTLQ